MHHSKAQLASLLALLFLGLALTAACSDDGTTTSCEDMPIVGGAGEGNQADLERWWQDAVKAGCATPRGSADDFRSAGSGGGNN